MRGAHESAKGGRTRLDFQLDVKQSQGEKATARAKKREELSLEGSLTLRGKVVLDSERRIWSHQMLCVLPTEIYFCKSMHLTDPKRMSTILVRNLSTLN